MPTLLEKIEAAALERLPLTPGRHPKNDLAPYRDFLKVQTHRLKMLHRLGAGGLEICQARSVMVDALLRHLLEAVQSCTTFEGRGAPPLLALVATGGYGRRELNPHSDIDLMFLHDGNLARHSKSQAYIAATTEGLLYPLYDIGLKVSHAVRNIEDCVKIANTDMQSKTALVEARLIAGDSGLFDRMQKTVLNRCVEGFEDAYVAARLKDQAARRAKYGDSACMQEPNIKNGCGGLRDCQNLFWMAFFKYRVRTLEELQDHDWISETERRQIEAAYDFLLRVRNDLHYLINRCMDVLPKEFQPAVALRLGFDDRSQIKRLERFMRLLYTHLRNIYLITRTVEQRLALLQPPPSRSFVSGLFQKRPKRAKPQQVDGFILADGEIAPDSSRVFSEQPRRLMRVFLHAQQRGLRLHPDLVQLIRNQMTLVDREFLRDAHVRETFLEIINQRGNVAPVLRSMHEVGLLGRYLPEFGKLTCLVQHEFLHRYTADEHTLICLEMLDQVSTAKKPPFSHYTEVFQKIERPFILYLALLLHDSGKAKQSASHTDWSAKLSLRAAKRLGLEAHTTETLRLLIANHLAMAQISQRRDLEDPAVVRNFAAQIKSIENLNLLALMTFADSQSTSANLWNDFKEALLWTLYSQTAGFLSGQPGLERAAEQHRQSIAQQARQSAPRSYGEEEIKAHFDLLPQRYFEVFPAKDILADLALAHRFLQLQASQEDRALEPVIAWKNEPDRGHATVRICTWDRAGLFSHIAGCLTAARLNILSAQIFSRADGIIFDTFFVADARIGTLPNRREREQFDQLLKSVLTGPFDLAGLIAKQKVSQPIHHYLESEQIPTVIRFDNSASDSRTVIDVETEDRLGLLFTISKALAKIGLDISTAKICTEKGAAFDSFYVSELDGAKVTSADRLKTIERKLRAAISKLDTT